MGARKKKAEGKGAEGSRAMRNKPMVGGAEAVEQQPNIHEDALSMLDGEGRNCGHMLAAERGTFWVHISHRPTAFVPLFLRPQQPTLLERHLLQQSKYPDQRGQLSGADVLGCRAVAG